jgi:hypothetical protein
MVVNGHRPTENNSLMRPSVATFRDGLPMNAALCKHKCMFVVVALRRFVCLFALLGIVLGPVSVSAAASAMALSSDMQMESMPGMDGSDEMPGCPEEQPAEKNKCGSACPLALICSTTILAADQRADGWRIALATHDLSHAFLQEGHLPSTIIEPPARPPRA